MLFLAFVIIVGFGDASLFPLGPIYTNFVPVVFSAPESATKGQASSATWLVDLVTSHVPASSWVFLFQSW